MAISATIYGILKNDYWCLIKWWHLEERRPYLIAQVSDKMVAANESTVKFSNFFAFFFAL